MSDHQLQVNEGGHSPNWLANISSVLILVVLVAIAFLMYSLNRKLDTIGQVAQPLPVVPTATLASVTPVQPVLTPPLPAAAPVSTPAVRRTAARPASNRNYTGTSSDSSSAIPPHEHTVASMGGSQPAPVAAAPAPPAYVPQQQPAYTPVYTPVPAPPPAPRPQMASLPAGTIVTVRMISSVNSDTSRAGDRFTASLDEPIYANGVVAVPSGATLEGKVVEASQAGRVSGVSELSVQLDRLLLPSGDSINLATDVVSRQGETSRTSDVTKVGVGAAIGAAIGAISGGRRGAGIGAATGAGAGTAGVLLSRGKPVILSPETRLSFSLAAPVQFEVGNGYSQSSSVSAPSNVAPTWPASSTSSNDPFDGQRPRLRRRTEFN